MKTTEEIKQLLDKYEQTFREMLQCQSLNDEVVNKMSALSESETDQMELLKVEFQNNHALLIQKATILHEILTTLQLECPHEDSVPYMDLDENGDETPNTNGRRVCNVCKMRFYQSKKGDE